MSNAQKIRHKKRLRVGYNTDHPEQCSICAFYKPKFNHNGEHFNESCGLHFFTVNPYAICNDFKKRNYDQKSRN